MAKNKTSGHAKATPGERSHARMKRYLWLALALGLAFAVGVPLLFQLLHVLHPPPYTELSSSGGGSVSTPTPAALHRLFFSGEPHLVFCTNATGTEVPRAVRRVAEAAAQRPEALAAAAAVTARAAEEGAAHESGDGELEDWSDEEEYAPLSKDDRARMRRDGGVISTPLGAVRVVTLDCAGTVLPSSGLNVLQRFGLPEPPLIQAATGSGSSGTAATAAAQAARCPPAFFVAHGSRPRWLPGDLLSRPDGQIGLAVMDHLYASRRQARTQAVQSDKFLARDCFTRRHCALVLHDGSGAAGLESRALVASVHALHRQLPFVHVMTIDTRKYTLSLQRSLGALDTVAAANQKGTWPRLLYFRRGVNLTAPADGVSDSAPSGNNNATSVLYVKSHRGLLTPLQAVTFVRAHADVPEFDSTTGQPTSQQQQEELAAKHRGLRAMTPLSVAATPRLRSGANNFGKGAAAAKATKFSNTKPNDAKGKAKPGAARSSSGSKKPSSAAKSSKSPSHSKGDTQKQKPQPKKQQQQKKKSSAAEIAAEALASQKRKEEAARAAHIREQMEAEAAELNTVHLRTDDDEEEEGGRPDDDIDDDGIAELDDDGNEGDSAAAAAVAADENEESFVALEDDEEL